jgi:hypothetical protein
MHQLAWSRNASPKQMHVTPVFLVRLTVGGALVITDFPKYAHDCCKRRTHVTRLGYA